MDGYLKWIPYAIVFMLDLVGLKTRSGWKKQMFLAGITDVTRYLIVDNLKKLVKDHRPAPFTGNNHSFPSGHTSSSFAGAEFMHRELKNSMPVLSCAGYLAATVTATIRLAKNRHWLKDVAGGAAIGILSAGLAYVLVNRISKTGHKEGKNTQSIKEEANSRTKDHVHGSISC